MAVTCGVVDSILEQRYYPLGAPWLYGADDSDDNPRINGLLTAIFASRIYRHFTWLNFCITWLIYCISYILL